MKQAALDLSLSVKKTRKREFLEQMDCLRRLNIDLVRQHRREHSGFL